MVKKKEENTTKVKEAQNIDVEDKEISIDISEIKDDLTEYMKNRIDKEVAKAVDKSSKKLIRYKNSIILKKNIIIIILLIICVFLGYNMYSLSNININVSTVKKGAQKVEIKKSEKDEIETDNKENELENRKKKYKHLVDDIFIGEDSIYIKDFYEGNLSDEVKLYLALNNIDDEKIVSEDESVYVDEDALKESYDNFFEGEFIPKSFNYNNLKFHYLSSKSLFIADGKYEKVKNDIVKEIINIDESDNLVITTIEGIIKDSKLYNVISGEEIKKYKLDDLSKYEKDLTKVVYYFVKSDDVYKIDKIEVK